MNGPWAGAAAWAWAIGTALLAVSGLVAAVAAFALAVQRKRPAFLGLGTAFLLAAAAATLAPDLADWLARLAAGRRWIWVEGNHDPGPVALPGSHRTRFEVQGLGFCHIATAAAAEISGHYHPKARIGLGGGSLSRPCFLIDRARIVLPAFGTYTGGLSCTDPVLADLMGDGALAVLTGSRAHALPMPRSPRRRKESA